MKLSWKMLVASHSWHLEVDDKARRQIDQLPLSSIRMTVFRAIQSLLVVDDHPRSVAGVKKLSGENNDGQWRMKQGFYLILFDIEPGEVEHQGFTYKGIVRIRSVVHRRDAYRS